MTLLLLIFPGQAPGQNKPLKGYSAEQAEAQFELESRFDGLLQTDNLRNWLKRLAAHPQHLGSPYRKDNAEFILSLFQKWGFAARIEAFYVYFPTPKMRKLEMVAPTSFHAKLTAPPVEGDPVTAMQEEQLPSYNAYSIDGDVTGKLVYANQGLHQDYAELERRGIDVRGKIVIVRYGGCFRGIKPKVAAEKGAIGCLIYTDPIDSGYAQGDVYPRGSFMPADGVQRGSVLDITKYPGDPLTPFVGATKQAERIDPKDAPTLTSIPVLPLSYADAQPLLEAMNGPVAPPDWRGALPITYHLGPGEAEVRLQLEFDWKLTPAYNVIAMLEGGERPDEWIIRGNHSDGWVAGAADPLSGLIVLLEEARVISELTRSGWRPKRTLVFCAWDAEEQGIIGSTEWVEAHAAELKEKAAVYINTDSNGRGFLRGGGSPTLEEFFAQVARDVVDPQTGVSVAERAWAYRAMRAGQAEPDPFRLSALGSGSDYASFLQHLGVTSLDVGYGGENRGGIGHSIYDTFPYYVRFGDPTFAYGITLAKTTGRILLRLANADILPFDYKNFSDHLTQFVTEVRQLWERMRTETDRHNHLIQQEVFALAHDPMLPFIPPASLNPVPSLDFSPIETAISRMENSIRAYDEAWATFIRSKSSLSLKEKLELDRILYRSERALTRAEGLPRRPWFKHFVYAPGTYTGYGVKTFPGVREAIEHRNWTEARAQIPLVAEVLGEFTAQVKRARELLEATVK
jgi:N-acetylated-alpha-linked acidic dipeptidase